MVALGEVSAMGLFRRQNPKAETIRINFRTAGTITSSNQFLRMNISQFAGRCGLTQHTLRYYEKIGLLPEIGRNASNHRDYSERDIVWMEFVKRLKDTNMSLADIRRYAILREKGPETEGERLQLLVAHAEKLEQNIRIETEHLQKLNEKIRFYQKSIEEKKSA
jgi:DNA-binding transcriptional MerR regulator